MRSSVNPVITAIYLISWIFIGNYVFLNLFLAILLDGFVAEGQQDSEELEMLQYNASNEPGEDDAAANDCMKDDSDIDESIQTNILKLSKKQIFEEKKRFVASEAEKN